MGSNPTAHPKNTKTMSPRIKEIKKTVEMNVCQAFMEAHNIKFGTNYHNLNQVEEHSDVDCRAKDSSGNNIYFQVTKSSAEEVKELQITGR